MRERASPEEWDEYYRRGDRRGTDNQDPYYRRLKQRQKWECVMFAALGGCLAAVTGAFIVLTR